MTRPILGRQWRIVARHFRVFSQNQQKLCTVAGPSAERPTLESGGLSREEMVKDLCSSIIHEDDHMVVFNKAVGIRVSGEQGGGTEEERAHRSQSVQDVLPELCEKLRCSELDIATPMSRNHSGVLILTKSQDLKRKLMKSLYTAQIQKELYQNYLLISVGLPTCNHNGIQTLYMRREKIGEDYLTLPESEPSKFSRKKGDVKQALFQMNIISESQRADCALVSLNTNRAKWDSAEVFMTRTLAPVLGDHTYSNRVASVLGVPLHVSPRNVSPAPQRLPKAICQSLGVLEHETEGIPLHLHRHRIHIQRFPFKTAPSLELKAPLPQFFIDTLKKLEIQITDSEMKRLVCDTNGS
ncbi:hypothetical protein ScPMuIL_008915 [Solemya velum]